MTCAQMGGPATCTATISGARAEEMAKNGGAHVMSMTDDAHMQIATMMKGMSEDDNKKWMAEFQTKFDALPDMM